MIVLLDADVCIDFTRGRTPIVDRLRSRETVRWGVSAAVLFELERGAHFAPSPRAERARIDLLAELLTVVLPFDASAARASQSAPGT